MIFLIHSLIHLYSMVIFIDIILSWVPDLRSNPFAQQIRRASDLTCKPIRELLPRDLPFDFSPMIVLLLLQVVGSILTGTF